MEALIRALRDSLFGYLGFLILVWILVSISVLCAFLAQGRWRIRLWIVTLAAGVLVTHTYLYWPIFTLDDGPFYSRPFEGDVHRWELYSEIPLRRLGRVVYRLEVRVRDRENVLVLRSPGGRVLWQRAPEFETDRGRLRLSNEHTHLAWWGGWSVAVRPEGSEGGRLYLGPLGGFRYVYLSW